MKKPDAKAARPDPISMRLPEELKTGLTEAAKASGRTLNAEIRVRLEWSLEHAPELAGVAGSADPLERRVAKLEAAVFGTDDADDEYQSVAEAMIARAKG